MQIAAAIQQNSLSPQRLGCWFALTMCCEDQRWALMNETRRENRRSYRSSAPVLVEHAELGRAGEQSMVNVLCKVAMQL